MRKLLLGAAALLGFAGTANAAGLVEINPATSPASVGDATGTVAPSFLSAFSAPKTKPDPGKVIIRLDGLLDWDVGFGSAGSNKGTVYTAGVPTGQGKLQSFQMSGYFRLYFGVDGQLTNGILYGANSEMRTNFAPGNAYSYTGSGNAGNASANSTASLWYTRRAFGYVGTPTLGLIRYGQGDGALSLFTGAGITTGEAFSTGAWDGDLPDLLPGNSYGGWAFNDIGNEYASDKIVYISPTFAGFNFAASYAPSSCALSGNQGASAAAGGSCQQTTSVVASDLARPANIAEAAVRWQPTFGPVAIDSMFGWQHSGHVNNGSFVTPGQQFKGVDDLDAGASATILGASLFGHVVYGTENGITTPTQISPTRGAPKMLSWVGGGQYSIGPWTVGASYWSLDKEGSAAGLGNQSFRAEAVGGFYTLTNGWNVFLEYLHGELRQAGVNFVDVGGPINQHNHVSTNALALTSVVTW